jgi:hypothetical protein
MVTFNPNEVPHLFIGFGSYGHVTSDSGLTDLLNNEDFEDGVPTNILVDMVTNICHRDGLEYICDENLTESGLLELNEDFEIPAVSLKDWLSHMAGN